MSLSSEIAGALEESEREEDLLLTVVPPTIGSSSALSSSSYSYSGLVVDGNYPQPPSTPSTAQVHLENITLPQRMLSACAGSLITSLVVTPFDVVRIRLQQQQLFLPEALNKGEECCTKVFWMQSDLNNSLGNAGKNFTTTQNGNIVAKNPTANIINQYCISNTCAEDSKIKGTYQGLIKIYQNEGLFTLYRGLSLTLLMAIPSNVVYFSGYEYFRDNSPLKNYQILNPLLCGAFARILAATAVSPFELLKTRLQAVPTTSSLKSNEIMKRILSNTYHDIKQSGIKTLFTGLQITLWRDVPFSAIYWSSYEFCSKTLKKNFKILKPDNQNINRGDYIDPKVFFTSFLSGSLSGILAALFTNPFDVGKTRLQVSPVDNDKKLETKSKKKSMFKFLYNIVKTEGFSSLYVGIVPRCLKIAPSCAIMISTYEVSKRFFGLKRE
ncbi:hypothetical protein PACTADRAFT_50035 [Pachysolen tannophilus NRRL Y-2460]|uniref:Mitochondrial carrier protein MTM1 n=1 Tax=Pachysolen tannophilus NRRL Y-2460 TaxID=669874 RepID=A0A1E4TUF8_PACTA|nr:hypothetical protein PACTADRAFT_50035 [Pachysolen tannophilus NRRL Y-2460]